MQIITHNQYDNMFFDIFCVFIFDYDECEMFDENNLRGSREKG
jgi:hypothetical protein